AIIATAKNISYALGGNSPTRVYVEDIGSQGIITDLLKAQGIPAKPFPVRGQTKEGKLQAVAPLIELGNIMFPEKGAERLIEQLIGFGGGDHDDLVDAFTMVILQLLETSKNRPSIHWLSY
ncbi:MAG: hypothetical protein KGH79_00615, partial [Patescibacteria group bacterium]|nr:hypothetical protein [Patescibacteria group bacterium]